MEFPFTPLLLPFRIINDPSLHGIVTPEELLITALLVIGIPFGILILAALVFEKKGK